MPSKGTPTMMKTSVRVAVYALLITALGCTKSPVAPTPTPPAPLVEGVPLRITITPNVWTMPAGGGDLELVIETAANQTGGAVAANVPVTLETTAGTLTDLTPRTDQTGHVRVMWSGSRSTTITAHAGGVSGTSLIKVP